jgi:hypothetical protein
VGWVEPMSLDSTRAERVLRATPTPLLVVALATLHYVASWGLFLLGFSLGMSDFDEGPSIWGAIGRALFIASQALWWPTAQLTMAHAREMSSSQSHALIAANSGAWGCVLALCVRMYRRRRARPREATSLAASTSGT